MSEVSPRARGLWRSLIAVVAGNIVYLLLEGWLPPGARHEIYRIDWGLVVDFWFCLVIYGLLGFVRWFR